MTPRLKCSGNGCPIAKRCWRFVAPAHPYTQDYLDAAPFDVMTGKCEEEWPIRKYDRDVIAGKRGGDRTLACNAASTYQGNGRNSA